MPRQSPTAHSFCLIWTCFEVSVLSSYSISIGRYTKRILSKYLVCFGLSHHPLPFPPACCQVQRQKVEFYQFTRQIWNFYMYFSLCPGQRLMTSNSIKISCARCSTQSKQCSDDALQRLCSALDSPPNISNVLFKCRTKGILWLSLLEIYIYASKTQRRTMEIYAEYICTHTHTLV